LRLLAVPGARRPPLRLRPPAGDRRLTQRQLRTRGPAAARQVLDQANASPLGSAR
jgi:hypothetical protein